MQNAKTVENWSTVWLNCLTPVIIFKGSEICIWERDMQPYIIHTRISHTSKDMETTEMLLKEEWIKTLWCIYSVGYCQLLKRMKFCHLYPHGLNKRPLCSEKYVNSKRTNTVYSLCDKANFMQNRKQKMYREMCINTYSHGWNVHGD